VKPSAYQRALASIFRLYPFYSGTASIPNHPLFKKISGPSDREGWTSTPGGQIYASLGDFIGRAAFFSGDLDPKLTWIVKKLVKPGDIVFDVGANLGIFTLLFSQLIGTAGRVHAFEPNPTVMGYLRAAISRKSAGNVTLNQTALGQQTGIITLKVPDENQGGGSIIKWRDAADIPGVDVPLTRLDDYVAKNGVTKIDFLKVDTEGAELEVLRGGMATLENIRPRIIVFEDSSRNGSEQSEQMKLLRSAGYQFMMIPKQMLTAHPTIVRPDSSIEGWDLIAARSGHDFEITCKILGAR
jgi:FkbM family methyltransferase